MEGERKKGKTVGVRKWEGVEIGVKVGIEVRVGVGQYAGCNLCDLHVMPHHIMALIFLAITTTAAIDALTHSGAAQTSEPETVSDQVGACFNVAINKQNTRQCAASAINCTAN